MPQLAGNVIEYTYDGADSYRVRFGEGTATWEVLTGKHAGSSRKEVAQTHDVAPGMHFVTWLEPTDEVVTLLVDLNTMRITCSYTYAKEQFLWRGTIVKFDRQKI